MEDDAPVIYGLEFQVFSRFIKAYNVFIINADMWVVKLVLFYW